MFNLSDRLHTYIEIPSEMSILEYNGGAVIAMAGKDCVGICSDLRLGAQALTVSMDFQKVAILFYFLSIQF